MAWSFAKHCLKDRGHSGTPHYMTYTISELGDITHKPNTVVVFD